MNLENKTTDKAILLLGFQMLYAYKIIFFLLVLTFYSLTIIVNVMIVALVSSSPCLHHPMYFFLSNLSISDLILTTTIVPNMLYGLLRRGVTMSIAACITQVQFFGIAIVSECLLLAVMSYDRYLAICNPLQYVLIMSNRHRFQLVIFCWSVSMGVSCVTILLISRLDLCGPNIIYHFFCDFAPILRISCSETFGLEFLQKFFAFTITVLPLVFISVTYVHIIISILKIQSSSGRQKAFSTCSSHLAVVGTFFASLISLYVVPSTGNTLNANKILSLLYTVITPLFNPIIYSLRNLEMRATLGKCLGTFRYSVNRQSFCDTMQW
uniref:Olfactory receptor n=1 Tax=Xenopus tropicalis TaxID=8364 RepID=A0A803JZW1_XENTR